MPVFNWAHKPLCTNSCQVSFSHEICQFLTFWVSTVKWFPPCPFLTTRKIDWPHICRSVTISALHNAEASPKTSLLNVDLPWDSHDTSRHHSSQLQWRLAQTLEQGVLPWFLQQVFKVFMNSSTGTTALTDLTAMEPLFTLSLPKNVCCWCNSFYKKAKQNRERLRCRGVQPTINGHLSTTTLLLW